MKAAVTRRHKYARRAPSVNRWPFGSAAPWGSDDPESRSLLELIAQSTNDGIWVLDLATLCVYFSERWLEHVGYSLGELPGHFNSFFDRVHPRDQARVKLALDQYVSGQQPEYRVEFRMLHKDGSWRQILTRGIALRDAAGRPFRMAGTHTDITERAKVEERLEKLVAERTAELRAARDRAELDAATTVRFLAAASHDIRQPLQAMALLLGALRNAVTGEAAQPMLHAVESSLAASMELLDSLLEYSRLDAGALRPFIGTVAVGRLIDQAFGAFAAEAAGKGLLLTAVRTRAATRSDAQLLARILRNLVSNAVKYTDRGRIVIGCRRRDGRLWLEVWDTGRGIPEAEQRQVFWEFYQAKAQRGAHRGIGLGLAIVDRLARLLKHPIHVRSWPGRGSMFAIELPIVAAPASADLGDPAVVTPDPVFVGKLIAVLENDQAVTMALTQLLVGWGAQVVRSEDDAALLAKLAGRLPDAVIADMHLAPDRDGFGALDRLERAFGRRLPSLILTGDYNLRELAQLNHAKRQVLQKPVWPAVLHAVLRGEFSRLDAS